MKKIIFSGLLLLLVSPVFAWEDKQDKFEIAYEFSDYGYREPHMDYPIHISGKKQGVSVVYARQHAFSSFSGYEGEDPSFAQLEFRYMTGKVDYDGYWVDSSTNQATPATINNEKDYYAELALKMGLKYAWTERVSFAPFIGLGYRGLRNGEDKYIDIGGGNLGFSYQRTSTYIYAPMGLSLAWEPSDSTRLTLNGEFDWLIVGNQNSHVDGANVSAASNEQDKGYGVRASVKFEVNLGAVSVFAEPFWRYWKIQNSDVVSIYDIGTSTWYGLLEPFNIMREYGIRAGIAF